MDERGNAGRQRMSHAQTVPRRCASIMAESRIAKTDVTTADVS
jgi:hypothetical protein